MAFLAAGDLGGEVIAQRLFDKGAMAFQRDRDQPGQHDQQRQGHTQQRPGALQPAPVRGHIAQPLFFMGRTVGRRTGARFA